MKQPKRSRAKRVSGPTLPPLASLDRPLPELKPPRRRKPQRKPPPDPRR